MRALVIVLLLTFILAAIGVAVTASQFEPASAQPIQCVPDDETREQVRAIMLKAMEDALHDHLVRLHEVWMKDERGQPARATAGAQQGVRAFIGGRAAALKWNPPLCSQARQP